MTTPESRLAHLGYEFPHVAPAAANYVPYVMSGHLVFVSGQLPFLNGQKIHLGRVGENLTLEQGQAAAAACALNILAHIKMAVDGDWARVVRCIKLGGFVNASPDFDQHPAVINGASDIMVATLGDAGRHTRCAVGVSGLPFGAAVEIDAVFEIKALL